MNASNECNIIGMRLSIYEMPKGQTINLIWLECKQYKMFKYEKCRRGLRFFIEMSGKSTSTTSNAILFWINVVGLKHMRLPDSMLELLLLCDSWHAYIWEYWSGRINMYLHQNIPKLLVKKFILTVLHVNLICLVKHVGNNYLVTWSNA